MRRHLVKHTHVCSALSSAKEKENSFADSPFTLFSSSFLSNIMKFGRNFASLFVATVHCA